MLLRLVGGVVIVAAAAAAAILLNLTLLGSAESRNAPVGKLSPRAVRVPAAVTNSTPPAIRQREPRDGGQPDD